MSFHIYYDDDCEIYINGVSVASIKGYSNGYISIPLNDAAQKALKPNAENTIAVHCHQNGGGQFIDVGLIKVIYGEDSGLSKK